MFDTQAIARAPAAAKLTSEQADIITGGVRRATEHGEHITPDVLHTEIATLPADLTWRMLAVGGLAVAALRVARLTFVAPSTCLVAPCSEDRYRRTTVRQTCSLTFMMVLSGMVSACSTGLVPESQREEAVGIYKSSTINPGEWQHLATIHGWVDDFAVCTEIVEFLEEGEDADYVCSYVKDASGTL